MQQREESEAMTLLVESIGADAAALMVESLAGTKWYVPTQPGHAPAAWNAAIGRDLAEQLRRALMGEDIRIPRHRATLDELIARDAEAGMLRNEMALKWRMDIRGIQMALKRHRERSAARATPDLFGEVAHG